MDGWLIRITGTGEPPVIRLFAAAESDSRAALIAVHIASKAAPDKERIETVGPLSDRTAQRLGLEPGQVLELSS